MNGYIVIEIQTAESGAVGNFVWGFADPKKTDKENRNDAFSKYFAVMSSAAVSALPVHSCVILRNDGQQIAAQCFRHGEPNEE